MSLPVAAALAGGTEQRSRDLRQAPAWYQPTGRANPRCSLALVLSVPTFLMRPIYQVCLERNLLLIVYVWGEGGEESEHISLCMCNVILDIKYRASHMLVSKSGNSATLQLMNLTFYSIIYIKKIQKPVTFTHPVVLAALSSPCPPRFLTAKVHTDCRSLPVCQAALPTTTTGLLGHSNSVSTPRPTCCRWARSKLAGPRMRITSMALRSFESVKFCQMGSKSSLAFLPQISANSCSMSSASSCGHQEGGKSGLAQAEAM